MDMLDIYEYLPHSDCKRCGEDGCMAFAAALTKGHIKLSSCAPLRLKEQAHNKAKITAMMDEA